jgi:hypothetical protein
MVMKSYGLVLLSAAAMFTGAPAQAQNGTLTRTYVSSTGIDTNPCTIAAPCASFARAYTQVQTGGIVAALDPGKYGPLTVSGPVTVDGNGWAAITAPATGTGVTINAQQSDKVTLKGLNIDGVGAANYGVYLNTGGELNILDCTIKNTLLDGVYTGALATMLLLVSNTYISNVNSQATSSGVYVYSGAGSHNGELTVAFDHVTISDATAGVSLYAGTRVIEAIIADSDLITSAPSGGTPTTAFVAQGTDANVHITLKNVRLAGDGASINLKGSTTMYLSQVAETGGGLGSTFSQTDHILCDGTNHVSVTCNGTWSSQ